MKLCESSRFASVSQPSSTVLVINMNVLLELAASEVATEHAPCVSDESKVSLLDLNFNVKFPKSLKQYNHQMLPHKIHKSQDTASKFSLLAIQTIGSESTKCALYISMLRVSFRNAVIGHSKSLVVVVCRLPIGVLRRGRRRRGLVLLFVRHY